MTSMSDSDDSSLDHNEYTIQDYYRLIRPLWDFQQESTYLDHQKSLRTVLDFSLTHSLSLKNLQKREIGIGDIDITDSPADILVIRTRNNSSLSNVQHPYVFHSALRGKYVEFCPHFALGAYLFSRFHVPDAYGSLELQLTERTSLKLDDIKLLKGSHKLSGVSYSQQHKSSISALQLSQLNYKDINLNKLLCTQDHQDCERVMVLEQKNLSMSGMAQQAGFVSSETYQIPRNTMEPPQELMDQIFPFVAFPSPEFGKTPGYPQFKKVLTRLRRSLCQDMVIFRRIFPDNCLSKHPIFNSEAFNKFAKEMTLSGVVEKSAVFTPLPEDDGDYNVKMESGSSERSSRSDSVPSGEFQKLLHDQNVRIYNLEKSVHDYSAQHHFIYTQLSDYVAKQNQVFQSQSELLQKIQNTTSGLLVLFSSRQKNMIPLAQSSLQEANEHLSTVGTSNLRQGISNTMELLGKLNEYHQHHLPTAPVPIAPVSLAPATTGSYSQPVAPVPAPPAPVHYGYETYSHQVDPRMALSNLQAPPMVAPMAVPMVVPLEPKTALTREDLKRQAVLNRRLSRQASTLFEMWEDFKSLEKELKDHEITMTEWLKVHGSSERQFRHTRLKIIKFVEDEAARTGSSVEYVKQRLHDKMRNRLRPWTLDEVQRMLTSGKRINMDD